MDVRVALLNGPVNRSYDIYQMLSRSTSGAAGKAESGVPRFSVESDGNSLIPILYFQKSNGMEAQLQVQTL